MRRLKISFEWLFRWNSLSYGERKRVQLACALYASPRVIALDEPSNHLDEGGRVLLSSVLSEYRGIGLIISHDRGLLDSLTDKTLYIRNYRAELREGSVSKALEQMEQEAGSARREREKLRKEIKRLEQERSSRRALAQDQQRRRSKAGLDPKDHDGRFKKNLARISGKDGVGGKLLRQLEGREEQAHTAFETSRENAQALGMRKASGISISKRNVQSDYLIKREEEIIGYETVQIKLPPIEIKPGEKIALTGPNGCGKTSFIEKITTDSQWDEAKGYFYLRQEYTEAERKAILRDLEKEDPKTRGKLLGALHRLGSEAGQLLESGIPSPGETRKILFAQAARAESPLIILDEPTNHLDLPSIMLLEEALVKFPGAILMVSHDKAFRESVCQREVSMA